MFVDYPLNSPVKPDFSLWQDYKAARFSIRTPTFPQKADQTVVDPQTKETREYHIYLAERFDTTIFMVTLIDFPYGIKTSKELVMEGMKESLVKANPSNVIAEETRDQFLGHPSLSFTIDSKEKYAKYRVFFVDDTLYMLGEIAKRERFNLGEFDYFVEHFKLNP